VPLANANDPANKTRRAKNERKNLFTLSKPPVKLFRCESLVPFNFYVTLKGYRMYIRFSRGCHFFENIVN
jgi:hypothetical protein